MDCLQRLLADEEAATAVEYALIAAAIAAVIAGIVMSMGVKVGSLFEKTDEAFAESVQGSSG